MVATAVVQFSLYLFLSLLLFVVLHLLFDFSVSSEHDFRAMNALEVKSYVFYKIEIRFQLMNRTTNGVCTMQQIIIIIRRYHQNYHYCQCQLGYMYVESN